MIYGEAVEGSPDDVLAVVSVMADRVDAGNCEESEKGIRNNSYKSFTGNAVYNKYR